MKTLISKDEFIRLYMQNCNKHGGDFIRRLMSTVTLYEIYKVTVLKTNEETNNENLNNEILNLKSLINE